MSLLYLGVELHVLVMSYMNMAFDDEVQVYILSNGTVP